MKYLIQKWKTFLSFFSMENSTTNITESLDKSPTFEESNDPSLVDLIDKADSNKKEISSTNTGRKYISFVVKKGTYTVSISLSGVKEKFPNYKNLDDAITARNKFLAEKGITHYLYETRPKGRQS